MKRRIIFPFSALSLAALCACSFNPNAPTAVEAKTEKQREDILYNTGSSGANGAVVNTSGAVAPAPAGGVGGAVGGISGGVLR